MASSKAVQQPETNSTDRTSQVQQNLQYAQRVEAAVKERQRIKSRNSLLRSLDELDALPVTLAADVELRNDLRQNILSQLKQLEDE